MITRSRAIQIASDNFPKGPEALAEHLSVEVRVSPLNGVEGWCIRGPTTIVRLNQNSSEVRRRFTLAHELAHLVLGTDPDIALEPFRSDRTEEREADRLASEFLIPEGELIKRFETGTPIDAKSLIRLAKAAKVSPVMAACRVVNSTEMLGFRNAAVVFFVNHQEQWRYSHGLNFDAKNAAELLVEAMKFHPQVVRAANQDENTVVGSIIDAQKYQVLLIQLLPPSEATRRTKEESLRELSNSLFVDDYNFRQSVAASLGVTKNKCVGQTLDQAFEYFMQTYPDKKYTGDRASCLKSDSGQRYVRLYLTTWFP